MTLKVIKIVKSKLNDYINDNECVLVDVYSKYYNHSATILNFIFKSNPNITNDCVYLQIESNSNKCNPIILVYYKSKLLAYLDMFNSVVLERVLEKKVSYYSTSIHLLDTEYLVGYVDSATSNSVTNRIPVDVTNTTTTTTDTNNTTNNTTTTTTDNTTNNTNTTNINTTNTTNTTTIDTTNNNNTDCNRLVVIVKPKYLYKKEHVKSLLTNILEEKLLQFTLELLVQLLGVTSVDDEMLQGPCYVYLVEISADSNGVKELNELNVSDDVVIVKNNYSVLFPQANFYKSSSRRDLVESLSKHMLEEVTGVDVNTVDAVNTVDVASKSRPASGKSVASKSRPASGKSVASKSRPASSSSSSKPMISGSSKPASVANSDRPASSKSNGSRPFSSSSGKQAAVKSVSKGSIGVKSVSKGSIGVKSGSKVSVAAGVKSVSYASINPKSASKASIAAGVKSLSKASLGVKSASKASIPAVAKSASHASIAPAVTKSTLKASIPLATKSSVSKQSLNKTESKASISATAAGKSSKASLVAKSASKNSITEKANSASNVTQKK